MKTVGQGAFVMYDAYIAFRDNHDGKWRLSQLDATGMREAKLTLAGEFDHLWQVEEFITHHPR